jgi:hypothetical protein
MQAPTRIDCPVSVKLVRSSDSKRAPLKAVSGGNGVCKLGNLSDLPSHATLDRRTSIWLCEYNPANRSIAWISFASPDKLLREYLSKTEAYIRDQPGKSRPCTLDSSKSRMP